jgi:hypothetical protein
MVMDFYLFVFVIFFLFIDFVLFFLLFIIFFLFCLHQNKRTTTANHKMFSYRIEPNPYNPDFNTVHINISKALVSLEDSNNFRNFIGTTLKEVHSKLSSSNNIIVVDISDLHITVIWPTVLKHITTTVSASLPTVVDLFDTCIYVVPNTLCKISATTLFKAATLASGVHNKDLCVRGFTKHQRSEFLDFHMYRTLLVATKN